MTKHDSEDGGDRNGGFQLRPHVSFLPERELGVVVLVNDGTTGGMLVDLVANAIYDELLGKADTAGKRAALPERVDG